VRSFERAGCAAGSNIPSSWACPAKGPGECRGWQNESNLQRWVMLMPPNGARRLNQRAVLFVELHPVRRSAFCFRELGFRKSNEWNTSWANLE